MDDKTKITMLVLMGFVYTRHFKDDSKRGFAKHHVDANILSNDDTFQEVCTSFQRDCLDYELTKESKNIIAVIDTLDTLSEDSERSVKLKEEVYELFKSWNLSGISRWM